MPPRTFAGPAYSSAQALARLRGHTKKKKATGGAPNMRVPTLNNVLASMYATYLTPKQITQNARKETNLAVQDEIRALRYERGRELERAYRQQEYAKQMSGILAGYRQSDAAAVADAYNQAAGSVGVLGTGLVNALQASQQTAAESGQGASEALAGYTGDTIQGKPAANALVSKHLGIDLPVGTFRALEAIEKAHALEKGTAYSSQIAQQGTQEVDQRIRDLEDKYSAAFRDVNAKRPSLLQEAIARYQGQNLSTLSGVVSALTLGNTMYSTQAGVSLEEAKLRADIAASNAKTAADKKAARIAAYKAMGLAADGKTPLPGHYKAPNGTVQKVPYGSVVGPGGGLVQDPNIVRGGGGATGSPPKADELAELRLTMEDRARTTIGLDVAYPNPASLKKWNKAKIKDYLRKNYKSDFLKQFPKQGPYVEQMINQVTNTLWAEIQSKMPTKQR